LIILFYDDILIRSGQKQIFLTVNLKYEETECKIKIGGYLDLMRMVPIHFKKFHGIDFVVQVNNANVTEDTFDNLVNDGVDMIVVSLSLPFSDYTEIEQLEEYAHISGLDDNLQLPPLFNIPTDSMIPNDVYQEIEARLEVLDI